MKLYKRCAATRIESTTHVTISGIPLLALFAVGLTIVLLSETGPLWRRFMWKRVGIFAIRWVSRKAGQLHRMVHERASPDSFWEDGVKEWPKGNGETEKFGLLERKDGKGWHSTYQTDAILTKKARSEII